jgi:hypothetical protein
MPGIAEEPSILTAYDQVKAWLEADGYAVQDGLGHSSAWLLLANNNIEEFGVSLDRNSKHAISIFLPMSIKPMRQRLEGIAAQPLLSIALGVLSFGVEVDGLRTPLPDRLVVTTHLLLDGLTHQIFYEAMKRIKVAALFAYIALAREAGEVPEVEEPESSTN